MLQNEPNLIFNHSYRQIQIEPVYVEFAIKVSNKEYDKQLFC